MSSVAGAGVERAFEPARRAWSSSCFINENYHGRAMLLLVSAVSLKRLLHHHQALDHIVWDLPAQRETQSSSERRDWHSTTTTNTKKWRHIHRQAAPCINAVACSTYQSWWRRLAIVTLQSRGLTLCLGPAHKRANLRGSFFSSQRTTRHDLDRAHSDGYTKYGWRASGKS